MILSDERSAFIVFFEKHGWHYNERRSDHEGNDRLYFEIRTDYGRMRYYPVVVVDIIDTSLWVWRRTAVGCRKRIFDLADPRCFDKLGDELHWMKY